MEELLPVPVPPTPCASSTTRMTLVAPRGPGWLVGPGSAPPPNPPRHARPASFLRARGDVLPCLALPYTRRKSD